jgi:hypothetical protein
MIKIKQILYLSLVVSLFLLLGSCKKEYVKTAYNNVEEFTIADLAGNKLKASIVGDSIRVYWPPFQTLPANIKPQISVSSGASISPASGTGVAFKKGTSYTVTAQDGSKKTYFLIPMINQPAPVFEVAAGYEFTIPYFSIQGQYFIPDTNQTKLFLINSSNKNIPVSLKNASRFNSLGIVVNLPTDGSIDTGFYKIKLVSGQNIIIKGPYHFGRPQFLSSLVTCTFNDAGKSLKAGDEISFNYTLSNLAKKYFTGKFVNAQLLVRPPNGADDGSEDLFYEVPLTQLSQNVVHFKLPDDVSNGKISLVILPFELESGDMPAAYVWDAATEPATSIIN